MKNKQNGKHRTDENVLLIKPKVCYVDAKCLRKQNTIAV